MAVGQELRTVLAWLRASRTLGDETMFARLMGLKTISPAALHESMQQGGVSVVDVNSDQSWTKAHVPGAKHLDVAGYTINDLPSKQRLAVGVLFVRISCAEKRPMPPCEPRASATPTST